MSLGTLEVFLHGARGLKAGDFFSKTDAYALLTYSSQTQRSNTATNQGANPVWNQKFIFTVEKGICELTLKIMDEDMFTPDDHLGTVKISLQAVLRNGQIPPTAFSVVKPNGYFQGEVKVSMTFVPAKNKNYQQQAVYPPASYWEGRSSSSHGGGPYQSG